jgi:serine/threonine-protein kinase SRPK3
MDDIQTRLYCCPEVTLGAKWETSANIWGVACVVSPVPTSLRIDLLMTISGSRFLS